MNGAVNPDASQPSPVPVLQRNRRPSILLQDGGLSESPQFAQSLDRVPDDLERDGTNRLLTGNKSASIERATRVET